MGGVNIWMIPDSYIVRGPAQDFQKREDLCDILSDHCVSIGNTVRSFARLSCPQTSFYCSWPMGRTPNVYLGVDQLDHYTIAILESLRMPAGVDGDYELAIYNSLTETIRKTCRSRN